LSVNIIGAGRLGTALALALSASGYSIKAIVARRGPHARKAAQLIGDKQARALSAAQLDQLPPSDIIFITTPDDLIEGVAARLASALKQDRKKRPATVLHASGALSSEVLGQLREAGFRTGSMHPLISVSEPRAGALSLRKAFYCVEGERAAVALARGIVRDLGGQSFSLDSRDKVLYHAAAVMASGHMVALFDIAVGMLLRCGLSKSRARAVLLPLVRSTLDNLSQSEPARALTGTFARADTATVLKHLDTLNAPDLRDALAAYIILGQHSLQLAQENGADAAALKEIARALDKAMSSKR
jgi:predicted short-subunit dehydrogenase-like oxidoreductase (DUF2520 family)